MEIRSLLEDFSDLVEISAAHCGRVYTCWLIACAKLLQHLIFSPDEEALIATTPTRLKKQGAILDCSEIFIEVPKDHKIQSLTWSGYKHHNILKFLICGAPDSSIVFISDLWLGGISDKKLTNSCGYLDTLEQHSEIMVDKGFLLSEECAARRIRLHLPPDKRGKAQMDTMCVPVI